MKTFFFFGRIFRLLQALPYNLQYLKKNELKLGWKTSKIDSNIPCPSFNIAAVIKTDSTFRKTLGVKSAVGLPSPFQATIIITLNITR